MEYIEKFLTFNNVIIALALILLFVLIKNIKVIIHKLTNYSDEIGVIKENLGKGKYEVEMHKYKSITGTVTACANNDKLKPGTPVQLGPKKGFTYSIKMYITKLDKDSLNYKEIYDSFTEVIAEAVKEHCKK